VRSRRKVFPTWAGCSRDGDERLVREQSSATHQAPSTPAQGAKGMGRRGKSEPKATFKL